MKIEYQMGVIASYKAFYEYGYFGWPSVTKLEDGTLVAGVSGLRRHHVCNDGKILLYYGNSDGTKWSCPRIVEDSQIDDRDTGVLCIKGNDILVSWFTGQHFYANWENDEKTNKAVSFWSKEKFDYYNGSYVKISKNDGEEFSENIRVNVTTPHGPIKLKSGALIYLGNTFVKAKKAPEIKAIRSDDNGYTWYDLGSIPYNSAEQFVHKAYHEPHVIELSENELFAVIRDQSTYKETGKVFRVIYSNSHDNGKTWDDPQSLNIEGSPPHLLMHSSGALICTYGFRELDFVKEKNSGSGQRAIISYDKGRTWSKPYIISDHIGTYDLGYPCTVELNDGSLYTVYYQRESNKHHPGLLYSKWKLPKV